MRVEVFIHMIQKEKHGICLYGINKRGIRGGRVNMAGRVAGKIKLQTVDELLGVPEIAGTQK